jgi:hypothetical protein
MTRKRDQQGDALSTRECIQDGRPGACSILPDDRVERWCSPDLTSGRQRFYARIPARRPRRALTFAAMVCGVTVAFLSAADAAAESHRRVLIVADSIPLRQSGTSGEGPGSSVHFAGQTSTPGAGQADTLARGASKLSTWTETSGSGPYLSTRRYQMPVGCRR